eukprot:g5309.t1
MVGVLLQLLPSAITALTTTPVVPATVIWDGNTLARVRRVLQAGVPSSLAPAVEALATAAARDAVRGPWTVMNKSMVAASGDKHDYLSIGSYWWNCTAPCDAALFANCSLWAHSDLGPPGPPFADCNKSSGLPWYDHDGYGNPVNDRLDGPALRAMASASSNLALSAFLLGDPAHAARAAALLRAFFLDAPTRMNPNGAYSQAIPGRCDGRGIGIIDFTHSLPMALDAAALLEAVPVPVPVHAAAAGGAGGAGGAASAWAGEDVKGLREWAGAFLVWLQTSRNGRDEANATNNHGSWYDVLSTGLAAHLGNASLVDAVCEAAPSRRIAVQVAADGSLPLEDSRTKSESYHAYDATALLTLADLCLRYTRGRVDLFSFASGADGRGLARAMLWLAPFASREQPWPFRQVERFDGTAWTELYHLAARAKPWAANATAFRALAAMQPDANTSLQNLVRPFVSLNGSAIHQSAPSTIVL